MVRKQVEWMSRNQFVAIPKQSNNTSTNSLQHQRKVARAGWAVQLPPKTLLEQKNPPKRVPTSRSGLQQLLWLNYSTDDVEHTYVVLCSMSYACVVVGTGVALSPRSSAYRCYFGGQLFIHACTVQYANPPYKRPPLPPACQRLPFFVITLLIRSFFFALHYAHTVFHNLQTRPDPTRPDPTSPNDFGVVKQDTKAETQDV